MNALTVFSILTGVVVAGEALALLVGMRFLSGRDNPWVSRKNDLFLALDFFAGNALAMLALRSDGLSGPPGPCESFADA